MCSTTFNNNENHWYGQDFPAFYNPAISLAQALLNAMNIYRSKVSQVGNFKTQAYLLPIIVGIQFIQFHR